MYADTHTKFIPPKDITFGEAVSLLLNQHPLRKSFIFIVMSVLRIKFFIEFEKEGALFSMLWIDGPLKAH